MFGTVPFVLVHLLFVRYWIRWCASSTYQEALDREFLRWSLRCTIPARQWVQLLHDMHGDFWRYHRLLAAKGCNLAKTRNRCSHDTFGPCHRNIIGTRLFSRGLNNERQTLSTECGSHWWPALHPWTEEVQELADSGSGIHGTARAMECGLWICNETRYVLSVTGRGGVRFRFNGTGQSAVSA